MALFVTGDQYKIMIDGIKYNLNMYPSVIILNGIKLLSLDNLFLKDINGLFITAKEGE